MVASRTPRPSREEELGQLIGRTRRAMWRAVSRSLEPEGHSIFVWQILSNLVRNGPSTQRDLAESVGQHPAGISRLVDALVDDALVRTRRCTEDRRRVYVEITPRGRSRFRKMRPVVVGAIGGVVGSLTAPERDQLKVLLTKLVDGGT
jgi:DNA-binding MarR family transcriptional regulator